MPLLPFKAFVACSAVKFTFTFTCKKIYQSHFMLEVSRGFQEVKFPGYVKTAQDGVKVVSLSHRPLLPPGKTPGTHFF